MNRIPPIPETAYTLKTLNDRLRRIESAGAAAAETVLFGTHAERLGNPPHEFAGALWYETDRGAWYISYADGWHYFAGMHQAAIASVPTDLSRNDAGYRFYDPTLHHCWVWDGGAWDFAPGEEMPHVIAGFAVAPAKGWQVCDGTAVTVANANATTAVVATPVLNVGVVPAYAAMYVPVPAPLLAGGVAVAAVAVLPYYRR